MLILTFNSPLIAQYKTVDSEWVQTKDGRFLAIPFLKHIPQDQINIIKSGFSTFTRIEVKIPMNETYISLHNMDCTVVYDTWDEVFDLVKLSPKQASKRVNSLPKYGKQCLRYMIASGSALDSLVGSSKKLPATVIIEQISEKQSNNIRSWLVDQQSPLIQNLFSHMLGKFKLEKRLKFGVRLPRDLKVKTKQATKGLLNKEVPKK